MKTKKYNNKLISSVLLALSVVLFVILLALPAKAEESQVLTPTITYEAESMETYIAEKKAEGYLYGGLFDVSVAEDETIELTELTQDNAITNPVDGTDYVVKLVPAGVLGIKGQVSGALLETETYSGSSIRMITAVDSLTYKEIGFSIKRADTGAELVKAGSITKYVYTKLYAVDATDKTGGAITYEPSNIHSDANYFKTYTITGVPTAAYNTDLVVVPYWVTADGKTVEGTQSIKTVNLGRSWVYVDASATDTDATGTYSDPFTTIQDAVDYTYDVQPETTQTVLEPHVILKSDYEFDEKVSIAKSLTLRSESKERSASESSEIVAEIKRTSSYVTDQRMFDITSGTVNVENVLIDGNAQSSAQKVRAIYVTNATLNLKDATIQNFYSSADQGGAAVILSCSELRFNNSQIFDCKTTRSGGSVYLLGDTTTLSTMTMNGGTISGGVATGSSFNGKKGLGGNIYGSYATVTVNSGTIEKGEAGGESYTSGEETLITTGRGGNIYLNNSSCSLTVNDGIIQGGMATEIGGNIIGWSSSSITINGGEILNGQAADRGGNILATSALTIKNATISGGLLTNADTEMGGGNIFAGKNLTIEAGTTINGGSAVRGGSIFVNDGVMTINGGEITGGGVDADGNVIATTGGNVYVNTGSVIVKDGTISGGKATSGGGNIYLENQGDTDISLDIQGGTISGGETSGDGGNIHTYGTVTMSDGTITSGVAAGNGGNLFMERASYETETDGTTTTTYLKRTLTLTGGTIEDGTATGNGGSIWFGNDAKLNVNGAAVTGGLATNGGNIYMQRGQLYVTSGKVSNGGVDSEGTVVTTNGGNVYVKTGSMTVNGGTVSEGTAVVSGGNVFAARNVTVSSGSITGGKATGTGTDEGLGGNVFISDSSARTVTVEETGEISDGEAAVFGGNVYLVAKGKLNVTGGTISGGYAPKGGSVYLPASATMTMSGGEVSGGGTSSDGTLSTHGGNIYAAASSTLTISGGTISSGTSTSQGGNIYSATKVTVEDGTIIKEGSVSGSESANGGNIFVTGALLDMNGGTVQDGKAIIGGNITIWGKGSLDIDGGTIKGGIATNRGGNICAAGSGTQNIAGSTTKISNGTVTSTSTSENYGGGNLFVGGSGLTIEGAPSFEGGAATQGGSIYVCKAGITLSVKGGTITGGTATNGGNIFCYKGTVAVSDGTIDSGKATKGGNIYIPASYTLSVTGGTISNGGLDGEEVVTATGGNVYCLGDLTIAGGTITGGNATGSGGNIYYENTTEDAVLTMTAGAISSGSAKTGGNVYVANDCVMSMSGGSITEGTASTNGGNINLHSKGTLNVSGDAVISKGNATVRGGDISALGSVNLSGSAVIGDETTQSSSPTGGNIYIASYMSSGKLVEVSTLTMTGGTIQNGYATTAGGCVYAKDQAVIYMQGGAIKNGTADVGESNDAGIGGNIYINAGSITVENATISDGESVLSRGGNIYMQGAVTLNINEGGEITGGKSKLNGGNIMVNSATGVINVSGGTISDGESTDAEGGNVRFAGATFTITSGTISGGKAGSYGGNILVAKNTVEISGGTISGGVADKGGSIYGYADTTVSVSGGTISGGGINEDDEVVADMGGNIYSEGTVSISGGAIKDGKVTERGGNIYSAGTVTISGGEISGGEATSFGGNIYTNATLTMTNGTVSGGQVYSDASGGGNIYVNGSSASMTMSNGTVKDGIAVDRGGNICVWSKATLTIEGGSILDGKADVRGGNICALGDLTISDGTISGGKASREAVEATETTEAVSADGKGGNIYVMPYGTTLDDVDDYGIKYKKEYANVAFNVTGGSITGGTAMKYGGNIFVAGIDEVTDAVYEAVEVEGENGTETQYVLVKEQRNAAYVSMTLTDATITGGCVYSLGGNIHSNDYVNLTVAGTTTITGGTRIVVHEDETTSEETTNEYNSNLYLSGDTGMIVISEDGLNTESSIGVSAGDREGAFATGAAVDYSEVFFADADEKEILYNETDGTMDFSGASEPLAYINGTRTFTPNWCDDTRSVSSGLKTFSNKWTQLHTYTASGTAATSNKRRLMSVAHRGDLKNYPENSAEGFLSAIALGADIVEMDLVTTLDGVVVLWHDAELDEAGVYHAKLNASKSNFSKVTAKYPNVPAENPGSPYIEDWTAEELRTYIRLKNNGVNTSYVIPTFEEVFTLCEGNVFMALDILDTTTRNKAITFVEGIYDDGTSSNRSVLANTLYSGLTAAQMSSKVTQYNMPYMQMVSSVKLVTVEQSDGTFTTEYNVTKDDLASELVSDTTTIKNYSFPKILRCGEYFEDYDSIYNSYKANYRIHIETLLGNDNRTMWEKLDNDGYGYSIIHTNDIEGLTDYIQDTWFSS